MNITESLIDGVVDIRYHAFRTTMQIIGIVLGVASVIATMSMVESSNRQSMEYFEQTGMLNQIVIAPDWRSDLTLTALQKAAEPLDLDDAENLKQLTQYVKGVEPRVSKYMRVRYGAYDEKSSVEGAGVHVLEQQNYTLAAGRIFAEMDLQSRAHVVIIGNYVALAAFGTTDPIGRTLFLDEKGYTVIGVLDEKALPGQKGRASRVGGGRRRGGHGNYMDWMNWQIYIPLNTMTDYVLNSEKVNSIKVILRDITKFDESKSAIESVLKKRRKGESNFRLFSAQEHIEESKKERMALSVTFSVVGGISLLVGGVVIMNILLASFNERVREVGIRKALGATWLDIIAQFLVESVVITILGGLIGIMLGIVATDQIARLAEEDFSVSGASIMVAFAFSVGVGIFFGFYPAVKAARLNTIEALRYE